MGLNPKASWISDPQRRQHSLVSESLWKQQLALYSSVYIEMGHRLGEWLKINMDTFECVQYHIHDGTEHILDVSCDSTHDVISNNEGIPANDHRVSAANVSVSWEEQQTPVSYLIKQSRLKTEGKS